MSTKYNLKRLFVLRSRLFKMMKYLFDALLYDNVSSFVVP